MHFDYMPDDNSGRKRALLLLLNFVVLGGLVAAWYYGWAAQIWGADVLKLSFAVIAIYLVTAWASTFDLIADEWAETIETRLPSLALQGTVFGLIVVFSVMGATKFAGASDFKGLIGPLLSGGGTALWPTFLALVGSNLLWLHLLIKRGV